MMRIAVIFCLILSTSASVWAWPQDDVLAMPNLPHQEAQEIKVQDNKAKGKRANQKKPEQIQIKEVPKAKRQLKPMAVKPHVKVKPIKIIKPKIKRP
jgi:hypothetical protein